MTISRRCALAIAVPTVLAGSGVACAGQGGDEVLDAGFEADAGRPSTIEADAGATTDATDATDASTTELCSDAGWCPVEPPRPEALYVIAAATTSGLFAVFDAPSGTRLAAWTNKDGWSAPSEVLVAPTYGAFDSAVAFDDEAVLVAGADSSGLAGTGSNGVSGYYGVPPSDPTQEWTLMRFSLDCAWPTMPVGNVTRLAKIGEQVYLAACTGLYRFDRAAFLAGSAEYFEPVYVDEDAKTSETRTMPFSVAGTASDDLWLAVSRILAGSSCLRLLHIGPNGLITIADSDPTATGCVANGEGLVDPIVWTNPGLFARIGAAPAKGVYVLPEILPDSIDVPSPEGNRLMRWTLNAGMDDVAFEYSTAANPWRRAITGVWQGKDRIWAVAGTFILQAEDAWNPSSAFQLSTQARNGYVDGKALSIMTGTPDALWLLSYNDGVALRRQEQ